MNEVKNIGLVAHDAMKKDMVEWCEWNCYNLITHNLFCTGTTGSLIEAALIKKIQRVNPDVTRLNNLIKLKSGPLGGDQQIGAMIANGEIDILFFFIDPLSIQPHDTDIKALLRLCALYNIPTACNRGTADFIIESSLYRSEYEPKQPEFSSYTNRFVHSDENK